MKKKMGRKRRRGRRLMMRSGDLLLRFKLFKYDSFKCITQRLNVKALAFRVVVELVEVPLVQTLLSLD